MLIHSGQGCALTMRMLVLRHYEQAVEVATGKSAGIKCGDRSDPATFCGPLVSSKQRDRVMGYIENGKPQSARLTIGAGKPDDCSRGYCVAPTGFADVRPDLPVFQEEILGLGLTIIPDDSGDARAVELASNSMLWVGWRGDGFRERAMNVARRIRTGSMVVNGGVWCAPMPRSATTSGRRPPPKRSATTSGRRPPPKRLGRPRAVFANQSYRVTDRAAVANHAGRTK